MLTYGPAIQAMMHGEKASWACLGPPPAQHLFGAELDSLSKVAPTNLCDMSANEALPHRPNQKLLDRDHLKLHDLTVVPLGQLVDLWVMSREGLVLVLLVCRQVRLLTSMEVNKLPGALFRDARSRATVGRCVDGVCGSGFGCKKRRRCRLVVCRRVGAVPPSPLDAKCQAQPWSVVDHFGAPDCPDRTVLAC